MEEIRNIMANSMVKLHLSQRTRTSITPRQTSRSLERSYQAALSTSPTQRKRRPKDGFSGSLRRRSGQRIPAGRYTPPKDDKTYALRAVSVTRRRNGAKIGQACMQQVTESEEKPHSSQMDVVLLSEEQSHRQASLS